MTVKDLISKWEEALEESMEIAAHREEDLSDEELEFVEERGLKSGLRAGLGARSAYLLGWC